MGRPLLVVGALLFAAGSATAEDVEGDVHLPALDGGDASSVQSPVVVYLTGFQQDPPDEVPVISQKDKTFVPNLRVIVAGQSVRFTNDDPIVHSVFSTSKARPFDLGKPTPGQAREVRFSTPGLVDVYCNIHEAMWATVLVLPNRAFALADARGHFVLHGAPPGRHAIHAWGWQIEPTQAEVRVEPGKTARIDLDARARAFSPAHLDKYGHRYGPRPGYGP